MRACTCFLVIFILPLTLFVSVESSHAIEPETRNFLLDLSRADLKFDLLYAAHASMTLTNAAVVRSFLNQPKNYLQANLLKSNCQIKWRMNGSNQRTVEAIFSIKNDIGESIYYDNAVFNIDKKPLEQRLNQTLNYKVRGVPSATYYRQITYEGSVLKLEDRRASIFGPTIRIEVTEFETDPLFESITSIRRIVRIASDENGLDQSPVAQDIICLSAN